MCFLLWFLCYVLASFFWSCVSVHCHVSWLPHSTRERFWQALLFRSDHETLPVPLLPDCWSFSHIHCWVHTSFSMCEISFMHLWLLQFVESPPISFSQPS